MDVGIGTQSSCMPVFWLERHLLIYTVTEHYQKVRCGKRFWHTSFSKRAKKQPRNPRTRVKALEEGAGVYPVSSHTPSICTLYI